MISLSDLTRRFGETTAVSGLTLDIAPGRVTALLGANGAGKTTTLNMLTTLLAPSQGTATVGGHDVMTAGQAVRQIIGYVPEHGTLYEGLTCAEYLELAGVVHGLSAATIAEHGLQLMQRFDLADSRDQRLGAFSKGMRRKALICAALLHKPAVLLLDEPMDGLDVKSQKHLGDHLRELAGDGRTVVYSSHILQQVEELCDDVVLIHQGKLRFQGALADLRDAHHGTGLRDIFLELTADDS